MERQSQEQIRSSRGFTNVAHQYLQGIRDALQKHNACLNPRVTRPGPESNVQVEVYAVATPAIIQQVKVDLRNTFLSLGKFLYQIWQQLNDIHVSVSLSLRTHRLEMRNEYVQIHQTNAGVHEGSCIDTDDHARMHTHMRTQRTQIL